MEKDIETNNLIEKTEIYKEETQINDDIKIQNLIHVVRGMQVMLDSDLAMLYQVETKRLNEAAKRNIERFPERFRFQLEKDEYENLKSHFATSSQSEKNYGGRRTLPYVYNEQGIAMLSAVLRSEIAVNVSIRIMDTFVEMRRFFANNSLLFERICAVEFQQMEYQKQTNEKFEEVFDYIANHAENNQKIFFDGQIYEAFSLIVYLIQRAQRNIILIDGYVDIDTLNLLSKKNIGVNAIIYTKKKTKLSATDIANFNAQYPILKIEYTERFHDRFLILDNKTAYHIGASIKDAGKKCFGITLIQDRSLMEEILLRLPSITP